MKFHFRDINPEMEKAWRKWFDGIEDVEVSTGDIFAAGPHDAIVSPANSFGYMDGGIDMAYSIKFGWDLQARLQEKLKKEFDGELPVGEATIVPTNNKDFPWLISAPTMRVPMPVMYTVNAYLAFRAVIREVKAWNKKYHAAEQNQIKSVLCPGLGTAIGKMPPAICAKQMFYAYMTSWKGEQQPFHMLGDAVTFHYAMLKDTQ